jgi:uncharacterized Zn-finger protein
MSETEIEYSEKTTVSCAGISEALGHPLVYLDLSKEGEAVCPYCSRHFKLKTQN